MTVSPMARTDELDCKPIVKTAAHVVTEVICEQPSARLPFCCTPPIPLVGISIGKDRGCQQSNSLADGHLRVLNLHPGFHASVLLPQQHQPADLLLAWTVFVVCSCRGIVRCAEP